MISIRNADTRGSTRISWLTSWHTFSFNRYYDPKHMGFRTVRVINDDLIKGGGGFGQHPHEDMEIITVVFSGALKHGDSLGHEQILRPGEVQRMSAGSGIWHSEFNASATEPVHLLQVWIEPDRQGVPPRYEQRTFEFRPGTLVRVAGNNGIGIMPIHQDADVYVAKLEAGQEVVHALAAGRAAYVQVATGAVELNGQKLSAGDGAAIEQEKALRIGAAEAADIMVFDLA